MISHGIVRARDLVSDHAAQSDSPRWCIEELRGRLCELKPAAERSGALLTAATRLIPEVQRMGDPVAWICAGTDLFFPPDLESNGVDLQAMAIVRVADSRAAAQAADQLLRSGCFGLLIIDLGAPQAAITDAVLGRLAGLGRTHQTTVLFLSDPGSRSELGSMISLRAQVRLRALSGGHFTVEVQVTKDKRRGAPWCWTETCHGPPGLS